MRWLPRPDGLAGTGVRRGLGTGGVGVGGEAGTRPSVCPWWRKAKGTVWGHPNHTQARIGILVSWTVSKKRPRVEESPLTVDLELEGAFKFTDSAGCGPVPPSLPPALQSP